jgi:hypothetical protein
MTGMVFKFRQGAHLKGDAQQVGTALMAIREKRGHLTAPDVVEEARPKKSALHQYFEWNDASAAEQYRLEQARHLVRSVIITQTDEHGDIRPIRAFAKVTTEDINSYEPIHVVLNDAELRAQVLRVVRSEIQSLREKVKAYKVDEVVESHMEAVLG